MHAFLRARRFSPELAEYRCDCLCRPGGPTPAPRGIAARKQTIARAAPSGAIELLGRANDEELDALGPGLATCARVCPRSSRFWLAAGGGDGPRQHRSLAFETCRALPEGCWATRRCWVDPLSTRGLSRPGLVERWRPASEPCEPEPVGGAEATPARYTAPGHRSKPPSRPSVRVALTPLCGGAFGCLPPPCGGG